MADAAEPKHPEAREFVRWVFQRSGHETVAEFARSVDETDRNIYRWLAGENAPSFAKAMKMMRAAGVLDEDAPVPERAHRLLAETERQLLERFERLNQEIDRVREVGLLEEAAEVSQESEKLRGRLDVIEALLRDLQARQREEPSDRAVGEQG